LFIEQADKWQQGTDEQLLIQKIEELKVKCKQNRIWFQAKY